MSLQKDTIAAISTPHGEAGISIVRLSGKEAVDIAEKLFKPFKKKKLKNVPSFTLHYGVIVDPKSKETIDEVLVSVMRAPATYTKEDIVEVSCHGGFVPVRRTLELLVEYGARLAEPGEFTKRAFLNGRIDLAQAEAVADIISAATGQSLKTALGQLKGNLSRELNIIGETLTQTLSRIEANIEFPEDEIETSDLKTAGKELAGALKKIQKLLATAAAGKLLREGLRTAIIGKPNTGKSSLLNELLEEERAIVTAIPGTTRDVIEEKINIAGTVFVLADTAGIRKADNLVEQKGIERSLKSLASAGLVLVMFDGSKPLTREDREIIKYAGEKKLIAVLNKSDLGINKALETELRKLLKKVPLCKVSVLEKSGLEKLKEEMKKIAEKNAPAAKESVLITNARHKTQLLKATSALEKALESLDLKMSEEFVALDIREALDHLGEITGRVSREDILNKIFGEFCIGK